MEKKKMTSKEKRASAQQSNNLSVLLPRSSLSAIGIFSLIFSVLELLTEFQYYVSEARVDMVTGGRNE